MLDYASFHSAHGIGGMGWGSDTVVSTVQDIIATQKTLSGQCDSSLRNGYNDDMSWMMHALAKLYSHNGQSSYISMAEVLFDTVKNSDDSTCAWQCSSFGNSTILTMLPRLRISSGWDMVGYSSYVKGHRCPYGCNGCRTEADGVRRCHGVLKLPVAIMGTESL